MNLHPLHLLGLAALTACNAPISDPAATAEDRFHEKSFSWDATTRDPGLAKVSGLSTRFENEEQLQAAIVALEENLRVPGYSGNLWKPIDYACDELALALWNAHGTVSLRDSVVLDESILKRGCSYIGDDSLKAANGLMTKSAAVYPSAVETDRQYPYKMIGESWDDFNIGVYKSTGGETQFKKDRERFGIKGWYDTDASRIGVRIYVLNCSVSGPRICYRQYSQSDWYSNDDYVSKRDPAIGLKVKMTRPTPENNWTPSPKGADLMDFRSADAVISMHSVNHAGLQFRAVSSSGLTAATEVAGPLFYDYVTW